MGRAHCSFTSGTLGWRTCWRTNSRQENSSTIVRFASESYRMKWIQNSSRGDGRYRAPCIQNGLIRGAALLAWRTRKRNTSFVASTLCTWDVTSHRRNAERGVALSALPFLLLLYANQLKLKWKLQTGMNGSSGKSLPLVPRRSCSATTSVARMLSPARLSARSRETCESDVIGKMFG